MKEKIEELKEIMGNIDTMIWLLEGNSTKSSFTNDGTIGAELDCYDSEGNNLRLVIESIIKEHGAEMLPTED